MLRVFLEWLWLEEMSARRGAENGKNFSGIYKILLKKSGEYANLKANL